MKFFAALPLLTGTPGHASNNDGTVAIHLTQSHGAVATISRMQALPQQHTWLHEPDGMTPISFTIEAGSGQVTASRAADLVGRPVDLVSYARIRAAMGSKPSVAGAGLMPQGSPLSMARLTSSYGMRWHPLLARYRPHLGVDLAAPTGTPIFASSDGVVGRADWAGGYGLLVDLEHGQGILSRYAHMSRANVIAGQRVRKGDVIGYVGSTGRSTGPHLHYEVRVNGQAVDPSVLRKAR